MDNHFAAGSLIAERLRAEMPGARVLIVATVKAAMDQGQAAPVVFVIPDIDAEVDRDGASWDGVASFFDQRWLVVVAVRNVQDVANGEAAVNEAGATVTGVLKALSGWTPSAEHGPLRRATAARLAYQAGFGWVPLAFDTRIFTEGSVNE